jgi:hypothetical protein
MAADGEPIRVTAALALGSCFASFTASGNGRPIRWTDRYRKRTDRHSHDSYRRLHHGALPVERYERFIGSAEVLGGLLVLLPWTGLIGALLTLGVTFGVFMVNMTYDVPVKLLAFHLVLMSIFLIAPDARRLINWFVLNRPVVPASAPRYGPSASSHRGWIIAIMVFTVWALGLEVYGGAQGVKQFGADAPKSPLYGIGTSTRCR